MPKKKNTPRYRKERNIHPGNLCEYCKKREKEKGEYCNVCFKKEEKKKIKEKLFEKIIGTHQDIGKKLPNEIKDIGNYIAVVKVDGNMMGRVFAQSFTPSEYSFKSNYFEKKFGEIVRSCVMNISQLEKKSKYIPFQPILRGGDDLMLITRSDIAIPFVDTLLRDTYKEFKVRDMDISLVTLSAGIAFARHTYPIYFLVDRAEKELEMAKKKFREMVGPASAKEINPKIGAFLEGKHGAYSFSVVSDTYSQKSYTFLTRDEDSHLLRDLIKKFVSEGNDSFFRHIRDIMSVSVKQFDEERREDEKNIDSLTALKEMHGKFKARNMRAEDVDEIDDLYRNHRKVLEAFYRLMPVLKEDYDTEGLS